MKEKISKFITVQHYTALLATAILLLATATFCMGSFIFLGMKQDIETLKTDGKATLMKVVKVETKVENIEKNIDSENLNLLIEKIRISGNEKRNIKR